MLNSLYSPAKQQLFTARMPLAFMPGSQHHHCLMAESMADWSSSSRSSNVFSQLIISLNLLFVHTYFHHSPCFGRKHVKQAFFSTPFYFLAKIWSNAFFRAKSHYGSKVFAHVTITSTLRHFIDEEITPMNWRHHIVFISNFAHQLFVT